MSLQNDNEQEAERQITPEEYLRLQKAAIRRKSLWAIGIGSAVVAVNIVGVWLIVNFYPEVLEELEITSKGFFGVLFSDILFLLGLFFAAGGVFGLRYAKTLTLEDLIPPPEAVEFLRTAQDVTPYYSYILVGCIVAVSIAQFSAGLGVSIDAAGFIKPGFLHKGEWWRILTGGALHGGFLHLYFNSQAFYGFGSTIEVLANRAHLAIVFVLAVVGGGLMSLAFLPEGTSVGASGGIMGLIGYLAIYGYRRKQQLPPEFLKSMLVNIGFIAAFGLIAYQIVDNFGHLGGLVVGAIYGFVQIPKSLHENPRGVHAVTEGIGLVCLGIFVFTSILSILLILQFIKF